jgi:hypothetical protein
MLRKGIALIIVATSVASCSSEPPAPTAFEEFTTPLYVKGGNGDINMGTHLRGDEEVLAVASGAPHPSDSRAQGQATFRVSGNSVDFKLIASNIDNVIMAHIHCGRFGENGPIRIWLYPVIGTSGAPGPNGTGRHSGVLASGTFSAAGVVCPAANVGTDMPVLEAMRSGLAYVNVHTNDGVAPTNTGPGDFPGGEIRGQLDK